MVDCDNAGVAGECELTLPSLKEDQEYVLESFSYEVTAEVEAARFLEQVSIVYCVRDVVSAVLEVIYYIQRCYWTALYYQSAASKGVLHGHSHSYRAAAS